MQQKSQDPLELLASHVTQDCNQSQLAEKIGISPQYLSEILNHKRPISDVVLDYLGLDRVITYQPKSSEPGPARKRPRRRRG